MLFDHYFNRIDHHHSKGRGLSIFNSTKEFYDRFVLELKKRYKLLEIHSSKILETTAIPFYDFARIDHCIIFQDLTIENFEKIIAPLIQKIIFPLFYRIKPISFFSPIPREKYSILIESNWIHYDICRVTNKLLVEQLYKLVHRNNFNFSLADFSNSAQNLHLMTPIEEKLKKALEQEQVNFHHQVTADDNDVDFLVEIDGQKVIIECDAIDPHNPHRDKDRELTLKNSGCRLVHCTASEVFYDINRCIEKVKIPADLYQEKKKVNIDPDLMSDSDQKAAMLHISAPARVLAPAGSGKTKTIINRIIHLINNDINPNTILALAFNRKAAQEMRCRLEARKINVSKDMDSTGVTVTTFHGLGYEIIRNSLGWLLDTRRTETTERKILLEAVESFGKISYKRNVDPLAPYLETLRKTKTELPLIDTVYVKTEEGEIPFKNIFFRFLKIQADMKFFNYDDMIYLAIRILLRNNTIRNKLQDKFQYVLIDEFQDLNNSQIMLMQVLALPQNNLFVVGDDDQMIYGWRGANVQHILNFNSCFAESQNYILTTNYRSKSNIVIHSKWLIDHNTERVDKNIKPKHNVEPGIFEVKLAGTPWKQALDAVNWIKNIKNLYQFNWRDFAVLYRYHCYQFIIATVLASEKIPHTEVDNSQLFRTRVGKDIYCYLTVLLHSSQAKKDDLTRILKRPNKYLENSFIHQIRNFDDLIQPGNLDDLEKWQQEKYEKFIKGIIKVKQLIQVNLTRPQLILSTIAGEFGLTEFYSSQTKLVLNPGDAGDAVLLQVIICFAENFNTINDFYEFIHRSISDDSEQPDTVTIDRMSALEEDKIPLTTIHATKGNEYNNVIYFNLTAEDQKLSRSELEEERRVAYVAMTRAIHNLLITAPTKGYASFLSEAALNPEFRKYSNIRLKDTCDLVHSKRQAILKKIASFARKKDKISMYQETAGMEVRTSTNPFKNFSEWLRQIKLKRATKRLNQINTRTGKLDKDLDSIKGTIEKIESEMNFRHILAK